MSDDPVATYLAEARRNWEVFGEGDRTPRLLAALETVLAEHKRDPSETGWCAGCSFAWPCVTVRAISAALLGEEASGG